MRLRIRMDREAFHTVTTKLNLLIMKAESLARLSSQISHVPVFRDFHRMSSLHLNIRCWLWVSSSLDMLGQSFISSSKYQKFRESLNNVCLLSVTPWLWMNAPLINWHIFCRIVKSNSYSEHLSWRRQLKKYITNTEDVWKKGNEHGESESTRRRRRERRNEDFSL